MPELTRAIGLSRTSIYELVKKNDFPKPIALTDRAVGWLATDVAAWLDGHRRAADAEGVERRDLSP